MHIRNGMTRHFSQEEETTKKLEVLELTKVLSEVKQTCAGWA